MSGLEAIVSLLFSSSVVEKPLGKDFYLLMFTFVL